MGLNLEYTKRKDYLNIFEQYQAGLKRLSDFKKWHTDIVFVIEEMNKLQKELSESLRQFRTDILADFQEQKNDIEKYYKNQKNNYDDPQLELLRRQDFDLELLGLSRYEIIERLKDDNREFSKYELIKIKNTYPNHDQVRRLVAERMELVENSFLSDKKYRSILEQEQILNMTSGLGLNLLYLPANNEKGYETLNLNLLNVNRPIYEIEQESSDLANLLND